MKIKREKRYQIKHRKSKNIYPHINKDLPVLSTEKNWDNEQRTPITTTIAFTKQWYWMVKSMESCVQKMKSSLLLVCLSNSLSLHRLNGQRNGCEWMQREKERKKNEEKNLENKIISPMLFQTKRTFTIRSDSIFDVNLLQHPIDLSELMLLLDFFLFLFDGVLFIGLKMVESGDDSQIYRNTSKFIRLSHSLAHISFSRFFFNTLDERFTWKWLAFFLSSIFHNKQQHNNENWMNCIRISLARWKFV